MSAISSGSSETLLKASLGRLITCAVNQLRPHPSMVRLHIVPSVQNLSAAAIRQDNTVREPLTITQNNYILSGHARWSMACMQGEKTLPCLQLDMTEEEALLWLIKKHQRSSNISDFSRILLALELEPWFKTRARSNQQLGGHMKGSSNLTEADKLDVRSEVAAAAGVSVGNVSKVKRLLQEGIPEVLQALREGEVSIHRASIWLRTPERQCQQLGLHRNLRGITRKIDSLLSAHRSHSAKAEQLDLRRIGRALTMMAGEQTAMVLVGEIPVPGEILLLSSRLLQALVSQEELKAGSA